MEAYSVVAFNTATASTNKIHDDEVAARSGFRGGLVPGVDVYAYLCHPPAERWGRDWLRARHDAGALPRRPCTTATTPTSARPTASASSCTTTRAGCARTGAAALGDAGARRRTSTTGPTCRRRSRRRRPSPEVLVPGTAFGLEPHGFHADKHVEYLADVREELPLYRERARRPPRLDPPRRQLRAVEPTSASARGSTSSRSCSTSPPVEDGQEVGCRAHRHRGVGAQGPPLRAARRPPHRRRPARGQDRPHRHLPPPRDLTPVCVDVRAHAAQKSTQIVERYPRPRLA